jgi:membrane protease YdiL (CAAX protease family)
MSDNSTGPDNGRAETIANGDAPPPGPSGVGASANNPTTFVGMLADPTTVALIVSTVALLVVWYNRFDFEWLPDIARETRLGWFGANFILLFIVPTLVMRLGYGMTLADLGVRIGDWRASVRYALIFGGVTIPLILISSRWQAYQDYYSHYIRDPQALTVILIGLAGWLVYFFAWEFHFRGFLLGVLQRRFGALAIVIQTVPFVMMHFGKPSSESLAAVVAGIALGWWAYRTRSCLGPWLLHWACSATMQLAVAFWPVQ